MSFNHRTIWSTRYVMHQLREQSLSEKAVFGYFLAIFMFSWLQFAASQSIAYAIIHLSHLVCTWMTVVIVTGGLMYLFRCNGGAAGQHFMTRYFSLAVTVGWKCVIVSCVLAFLAGIIIDSMAITGHLSVSGKIASQGWAITINVCVTNILLYWRIGQHLRSLAGNATNDMGNGSHYTAV